jgi:hypothetical protein
MKKIFYIIFPIINLCTYRKEAFHIFDPYYYGDLFNLYSNNIAINKCSISQGPNCFFLNKYNQIENDFNNMNIKKKDFYEIKKYFETFTEKVEKSSKNEINNENIKNLNNLVEYNLLLTFESYEEKVKEKNFYLPEEILTNFEFGYIKLTFIGKLLITKDNLPKIPNMKNNPDYPSGPYGIIESEELVIKFHKPMYFISVYARKSKTNKLFNPLFEIKGTLNEKNFLLASINIDNDNQWKKVMNTQGQITDSIILKKGFDIDNIYISYKANIDINANNLLNNNKYNKIIQKAIKEGLKKKNNNNNNNININGNNIQIININANDLLLNENDDDI